MPTAQQITDLQRHVRKLEPAGDFSEEYLQNLVDILNAGAEETVARIAAADADFNNDEVLADIGLETGNLAINSLYKVELTLSIESVSTTPGAEIKFVGPAGATLVWQLGHPADVDGAQLAIATEQAVSTIAGIGIVTAVGFLTTGSTIGTLKVQGAQGTSTAEDTDYKVGSNLVLTKIA